MRHPRDGRNGSTNEKRAPAPVAGVPRSPPRPAKAGGDGGGTPSLPGGAIAPGCMGTAPGRGGPAKRAAFREGLRWRTGRTLTGKERADQSLAGHSRMPRAGRLPAMRDRHNDQPTGRESDTTHGPGAWKGPRPSPRFLPTSGDRHGPSFSEAHRFSEGPTTGLLRHALTRARPSRRGERSGTESIVRNVRTIRLLSSIFCRSFFNFTEGLLGAVESWGRERARLGGSAHRHR
jgi:hypothetical protein